MAMLPPRKPDCRHDRSRLTSYCQIWCLASCSCGSLVVLNHHRQVPEASQFASGIFCSYSHLLDHRQHRDPGYTSLCLPGSVPDCGKTRFNDIGRADLRPVLRRTKRSKSCLTRNGMLHMMFKLGQCAEKKIRRFRGFDYLPKVITRVKFKDGIEVTDVDQITA